MKKELQIIKELLKSGLGHSEKLWNEKEESHAYIIGYLQSTIKSAVQEINKLEKLSEK